MKTVFEADSELEAQMMLDLLRRAGVEGQLSGQHLPGALGELPAIGLVRVLVATEHAADAMQIIREWESTQPKPEPPQVARSTSRGFVGFLMGAGVASAVALVWANSTPISTDGIDFDGDEGDDFSKVEADRNLDGVMDLTAHYRGGLLHESVGDDNFDGRPDTTVLYQRNNALKVISTANDALGVEYRALFENGILRRVDLVDAQTGRVRKVQMFRNGISLVEATWDSDGDGSMDTRIEYGVFEEEMARTVL